MARRRTLLLNGPIEGRSSFALVNRRLAAGLADAGYEVWTATQSLAERRGLPDVCLTHGHPYDARNAPGAVNVFFLEYDYARITAADRNLRDGIQARFDLCAVPSRFVRDTCRASGLEVPVLVCPLGVDFDEFHPGAPPVSLPTGKRFRFGYVGGATERKGVDILVEAFLDEFDAGDDVALILKTASYEHLLPWFSTLLERAASGGPEIIHVHGEEDSVAGYYTAFDVGVFPFRGEAFALPILECLASGTKVIVTRGGGPGDYCTGANATFVQARRRTTDGKSKLEPDPAHLRALLRAAYEGRGVGHRSETLRQSVAHLTWERTVATLIEGIESCFERSRAAPVPSPKQVVHAYGALGSTSWKKVAVHTDAALHARFATHSIDGRSTPRAPSAAVLLAHGGFALEPFAAAVRGGSRARRVLVRGNGPPEVVRAIVARERELCGLQPLPSLPVEAWRGAREEELAEVLLVHSRATARLYATHGVPADRLRIVPCGFTVSRPRRRGRRERLRLLFLGTDPMRKGIRILLEAWSALRPRNAELVCLADTEVLRSQHVLRILVRCPEVSVRPLVPHRDVAREYAAADCQILPSLEDGCPVAIGDGMGRGLPAIVSEEAGVSELITDGRDGLIVETGSVDALAEAIGRVCDQPGILERMGAEAFETARRRPWSQYESEIADLVAALAAEERP